MSASAFQVADQIVVPVQGTDREYLAQQWAVEFAANLGLPVRGVHVSDGSEDDPPESEIFGYLKGLCEKHSVPFEARMVHGTELVAELVDELGPRDLVVIGTRKLAHHYHVGSVTAALVEKAPCPVQVVRLE